MPGWLRRDVPRLRGRTLFGSSFETPGSLDIWTRTLPESLPYEPAESCRKDQKCEVVLVIHLEMPSLQDGLAGSRLPRRKGGEVQGCVLGIRTTYSSCRLSSPGLALSAGIRAWQRTIPPAVIRYPTLRTVYDPVMLTGRPLLF